MADKQTVAYFSMEIGADSRVPTYAGGLGVLAGDLLLASADLEVPLVGVTLLNKSGYFYQELSEDGTQKELPVRWQPNDFLELLPQKTEVTIEGRKVVLQVWKYSIKSKTGYQTPVYFLDADLQENDDCDRRLTGELYGRDKKYRLCQEIILGVGGVRILTELGYENVRIYHMNEGHSALLVLELARRAEESGVTEKSLLREKVGEKCVFTTHTPVPTAYDKFKIDLVNQVLEESLRKYLPESVWKTGELNMTHLALCFSHYVNGVAKRHGEVADNLFPGYNVEAITNGVYSPRWVSPPVARLFDRFIPGWEVNPELLKKADQIPLQDIAGSHLESKKELIDYVNHHANIGMDYDVLTIGAARRITSYKRPDLILTNTTRLLEITQKVGPIQLVFSGKAHPLDGKGKDLIKKLFQLAKDLGDRVKIAFLENYDMHIAELLVAGVDVWLNTPLPPWEASGTSGMKAAHNGVPHLSILDGWWVEGHKEGETGWAFGSSQIAPISLERSEDPDVLYKRVVEDANDLYDKLENTIVPMFYREPENWQKLMRNTIAKNAAYFNAHRMMKDYRNIYKL